MARPKTEAAEYKALMLRLPPLLLAALHEHAAKARRSVNAQIVHVLAAWDAQERFTENPS